MIFQINQDYTDKLSVAERSELYSKIIEYGHYVDCDSAVRTVYYQSVEDCGSKIQREMIKKDPSLRLNRQTRQYLTLMITSDYTPQQLDLLIKKPARLMVENKVNEAPVYRNMIGTYASGDRPYNNPLRKLHQALKEGKLDFENGGGCSAYDQQMQSLNENEYRDVAKYKICMLADRDTNAENVYDEQKNPLFEACCGKKYDEMSADDVYKLDFTGYVWHMWYKRAIENYFPDSQFTAIGADLSTMPKIPADRNYKKLGDVIGYRKNQLPKLADKMSYAMYEDGLKHFYVDGKDMSELQMFLLKLVKII